MNNQIVLVHLRKFGMAEFNVVPQDKKWEPAFQLAGFLIRGEGPTDPKDGEEATLLERGDRWTAPNGQVILYEEVLSRAMKIHAVEAPEMPEKTCPACLGDTDGLQCQTCYGWGHLRPYVHPKQEKLARFIYDKAGHVPTPTNTPNPHRSIAARDEQLWGWMERVKVDTVQAATMLGERIRRAGLYEDEIAEVSEIAGVPKALREHVINGWRREDSLLSPTHRHYRMT